MNPPRIFQTGESVTIRYRQKTAAGRVKLASDNGRSLMLEFDAMLGGYAGMMPVLWLEDRQPGFYCLVEGEAVQVAARAVERSRS